MHPNPEEKSKFTYLADVWQRKNNNWIKSYEGLFDMFPPPNEKYDKTRIPVIGGDFNFKSNGEYAVAFKISAHSYDVLDSIITYNECIRRMQNFIDDKGLKYQLYLYKIKGL